MLSLRIQFFRCSCGELIVFLKLFAGFLILLWTRCSFGQLNWDQNIFLYRGSEIRVLEWKKLSVSYIKIPFIFDLSWLLWRSFHKCIRTVVILTYSPTTDQLWLILKLFKSITSLKSSRDLAQLIGIDGKIHLGQNNQGILKSAEPWLENKWFSRVGNRCSKWYWSCLFKLNFEL